MKGEESGAPTLEETGKCDTWAIPVRRKGHPRKGIRWWDRSTIGGRLGFRVRQRQRDLDDHTLMPARKGGRDPESRRWG
jgi:hypothetical protein